MTDNNFEDGLKHGSEPAQTIECRGARDDPHEPVVMDESQNRSTFQTEYECPVCGTVVVG